MISDPFFNFNRCYERLVEDYKKHNSLLVAFDYDNTIYDYHKKGYQFNEVINLLRRCQALEFTLILFTSNEGDDLTKAVDYVTNQLNIKGFYVNESPINNNRKPYFNILLDDRAGLGTSYALLYRLLNEIHTKEIEKDSK